VVELIFAVPVCGEDPRPSHITVLRNRKFVVGSGRRYTDSVDVSLQPYGFSTLTTLNSAFSGTGLATRINPRKSRRL